MSHIFISYAKKDTRALAETLFVALNAVPGISAWMDMSLEADSSWAGQIQHEIDRCDYVVVLLSPDVNRAVTAAQRRSFVLNEIDYAQQENKPILPVMVQQTKMPVQLAGIQYIDLTSRPNDPTPIIERVRKRFSLAGAPEPVPVLPGERHVHSRTPLIVGGVVVLAVIAVLVLVALNGMNPDADATLTSVAQADATSLTTTIPDMTGTEQTEQTARANAAAQQTALVPTNTAEPTITDTPTDTPVRQPTSTYTLTPTDATQPTETLTPTETPIPTAMPTNTSALPQATLILPSLTVAVATRTFPCNATIFNPDSGATVISVVYLEASTTSQRQPAVRVGQTVSVRRQVTEALDTWFLIYSGEQRLGWILARYLSLSATCPE